MNRTAALWEMFTEDLDADPFHDRLDDDFLVVSIGGSPPGGSAFLVNELGDPNAKIILLVAFGANIKSIEPQTWNFYDITSDVRQADGNRISISSMGRSDESSQASPAGCTLQLDNTRGDYTRLFPGSKWYPNVQRNTPVKVQLYVYGLLTTEFQGEATSWQPSWDDSASLAIVTLSAKGVLRRINQGKTPLKSPFTRSISAANPVQHWSMEDGQDATVAGSEVSGGRAMTVSGTVRFSALDPLTFGSSSGIKLFPGTTFGFLNFPNIKDGGSLYASFPAGSSTSWGVQATVFCARDTADLAIVFQDLKWTTADGAVWMLLHDYTATNTVYVTYNGVTVCSVPGALIFDDIRIDASQVGGNISVRLVRTPGGSHEATGAVAGATLSGIVSMTVSPSQQICTGDWSVGEVRTYNGNSEPDFKTNNLISAFWGYPGENVINRITRLCSEEGFAVEVVGTSDTTMGVQGISTFISLLRECEATDDGLLGDGRGPGLYYITRQYRYNRPATLTLDMGTDPPQLAPPFEPVDDDQRNRNIIKVDQSNGSSAIYEDSTSSMGTTEIGDYDTAVPVNYGSESQLYNRGAHEAKKGVVDEFRYPKMSLDLAATPSVVPGWRALHFSDRIDVLNVISKATQHPPGTVSQIMEGYNQSFSPHDWQADINCSPFTPWRVAVIQGPATPAEYWWRLDSGGSSLASDYAAGVTSIAVTVSDGQFWSTLGSNYPHDISVGGVQVTANSAYSTADAFSRTLSPAWGNADTGELWTLFGGGGVIVNTDWAVGSGVGTMSVPATAGYRVSYLNLGLQDCDVYVTGTAPLATGGPLEIGNILMRGTSFTSFVLARAQVETTNALTLLIFSANGTQLDSRTIPGITHAGAGTPLRFRAQAVGTTIRMKAWVASSPEPFSWHLVCVDPAVPIPGFVGVRGGVSAGNTNALPVSFSFDDFSVVGSPQIMRISAVPYPLAGGSSVKLWRPPKLAL